MVCVRSSKPTGAGIPPILVDTMIFHNHSEVPYYTFSSLDAYPRLRHAVLTRQGGVSPAPWNSLNLGWSVGDERDNVETNYRRWTRALDIDRAALTTTWQVHGNKIVLADAQHMGGVLAKADGLITRTAGIPLVQRYADCTPILAYDPEHHACGIAHAGWQGTVARCAEALVRAMVDAFASEPARLVTAVGPAIGPCCYEVGPEVIAAIGGSQSDPQTLLRPSRPGHAYLDLWQANTRQLREAGVRKVEVAGVCTACHRQTFFSHRGDHGKSGRFAAFIMLEP
ncbi:MAG: peptidoglycan editing factor PgeF [Caldilineae bacterium]|nr:MAG: peptidoglycan editing factor PgeF [Caldilineae bacterium]